MSNHIEHLKESEWRDYPASIAAINAWRAINNEWSEGRTTVKIVCQGEDGTGTSHRGISVPSTRLADFLSELVREPTFYAVEIVR